MRRLKMWLCAVFMLGLAVGILAPSVVRITRVEAAQRRIYRFRCVSPVSTDVTMSIHNLTARGAKITKIEFNNVGQKSTAKYTVPPHSTVTDGGSAFTEVRSRSPIVVGGSHGSGDAIRQIACYKG